MPTIKDACQYLDQFAPTRLAEDWDNVGLLVGDAAEPATKIMTCLTVTPSTVSEAIENQVNLIVTHHPLPFRSLKRITTDEIPSRMLWQLIRGNVAIYSPHTAFDSAAAGINQMLGEHLQLSDLSPLNPIPDDPDGLGSGRVGTASDSTFGDLVNQCKQVLEIEGLHVVGNLNAAVSKVAIACGSGGSFLQRAKKVGCDTLVTGEATFHTCLEAESSGINLLLLGHYTSERFAVEVLAEKLKTEFSDAKIWASEEESDPLEWV